MRKLKITALLLSFVILALSLSSCSYGYNSDEYMTREEVEALLQKSMIGNISVEGGDTYEITIQGEGSNVTAASKGLLSAVSVTANFEMSYSSSFGPQYSSTVREFSAVGSGVIYSLDKERGDAYIITNYHVVYDSRANTANHISDDIYVELYGKEAGGYEINAEFVGGSMYYDLAVLKVTGSRIIAESNAAPVELADSSEVAVLDTAIAIGNPESGGLSVTVGHVNVDSEYITIEGADGTTSISLRVMRIDTAVNHGNSGGGLFDAQGRLIGIVNAKMSDSEVENIGYAIPSNLVKYVADNILYYCDGTEVESVQRCLIGITVGADDYYTEYDIESGRVYKRESVVIATVSEGGAADGLLKVGDSVRSVTVDGVEYVCDRMHVAVECMLNARVGSEVVFHITRDGVDMDVTVELDDNTTAW